MCMCACVPGSLHGDPCMEALWVPWVPNRKRHPVHFSFPAYPSHLPVQALPGNGPRQMTTQGQGQSCRCGHFGPSPPFIFILPIGAVTTATQLCTPGRCSNTFGFSGLSGFSVTALADSWIGHLFKQQLWWQQRTLERGRSNYMCAACLCVCACVWDLLLHDILAQDVLAHKAARCILCLR